MSESTFSIPRFSDGRQLRVGETIRLDGGEIMTVAAIAFTSDGVLLAADAPEAGDRGWFATGEHVAAVDEDSRAFLDADRRLTPRDYCARLGIQVDLDEGMSGSVRARAWEQAKTEDVMRRTAALAAAGLY